VSYSLKDLSAFAMPLFDSEASGDTTHHGSLDLEGADSRLSSGRGEAASTSAGIKGWFRKRQKSGDPETMRGGTSPAPSRPAPPPALPEQPSPLQGSKMKHILDSVRPRSRSDVVSMNTARAQHKSKSGHTATVQTTIPGSSAAVANSRSPMTKKTDGATPVAIDRSLSTGARTAGGSSNNGASPRHIMNDNEKMVSVVVDGPSTPTKSGHIGPEEFLEMYRERAYTDPRRVKEAALAARNKLKRVRMSRL
jgi:hypothetical protein